MTDVAVVVPGIMGSVLALRGEVVWPATVWQHLTGSYRREAELAEEHLDVPDVIRRVGPVQVYQPLLDALARCNFIEKPVGGAAPTLFLCPYDWRRDNREAAARLAQVVDEAVARHPGAVRVTLIAHSMGGLVSRYYLESGEFAGRPGLAAVRRLITLGTPHRGAPAALPAALGLEKQLWLDPPQVKRLANNPHFPSTYQLLPPPAEPFVWSDEAGGEYEPVDVYDDAVAEALGLEKRNLQAARDLHAKLDLARRPQGVRYFAFAGTAQITMTAAALRRQGAGYEVSSINPAGAGDGTVPVWSALLPGHQSRPVGGVHMALFRDGYLRQTLGVLLGHRGVLVGEPEGVEVFIRERVAHPADLLHVVLVLPATGPREGRLQFERAQSDEAGNVTYVPFREPQPVPRTGEGAEAETVEVTLTAPDVQGVYRLAFYWKGEEKPAGEDGLFVQLPAPP